MSAFDLDIPITARDLLIGAAVMLVVGVIADAIDEHFTALRRIERQNLRLMEQGDRIEAAALALGTNESKPELKVAK